MAIWPGLRQHDIMNHTLTPSSCRAHFCTQVPSRPSPPLLRDALRQSEGKNFLLQRMLAASSGLANPCSLLN